LEKTNLLFVQDPEIVISYCHGSASLKIAVNVSKQGFVGQPELSYAFQKFISLVKPFVSVEEVTFLDKEGGSLVNLNDLI
jgi:hypothetical protein